jgi:hypothetical protein
MRADREARRAIAAYGDAGRVLEGRARRGEVGAQLVRRHAVDAPVIQAMAGDFVAVRGDRAQQRRMAPRHPAQHEEGRAAPRLRAEREDPLGAGYDPRCEVIPGSARDRRLQRMGLEPFLDIDRQGVDPIVTLRGASRHRRRS